MIIRRKDDLAWMSGAWLERKDGVHTEEHCHPTRRILYWREGEALLARIEGEVSGQPRSREWRFEPMR
jgi:hypothetical protein